MNTFTSERALPGGCPATFDTGLWLEGVKGQPAYVRRFAAELAWLADPGTGELQAPRNIIRGLAGTVRQADEAFLRLKSVGALRLVERGHDGWPGRYALTYTASPVTVRMSVLAHDE